MEFAKATNTTTIAEYVENEKLYGYVKKAGIDLQLSGHTHHGQLFPFGYLTRRIYAGRDYGLHKDGTFQLYVSSGTGTWGPPIRTGSVSEIVAIELY